MIQKYIEINRILRRLIFCIWDIASNPNADDYTYVNREITELERAWPKGVSKRPITNLKIHLKNNNSLVDVLNTSVKIIEDTIDDHFSRLPSTDLTTGIVDYLHPIILTSSFPQFRMGQYRDAVLNSMVAIFDLIRKKTGIDKDGAALVEDVFSLGNPVLVISELNTDSGQNEQKGYVQILKGAYQAIRNPKAHSLSTDLDQSKAAEYLIFASHLARRIEQAKTNNT